MKKHWAKLGLLLILAATACASSVPIENVDRAPIPSGSNKLSTKQVGNAIAQAAIDRGWVVTQTKPNQLRATLDKHENGQAAVDIFYTSDSYSIKLASSTGFEQQNGMILSSYNRYIDYLKMSIDKGLGKAAFN